MFNYVCKLRKLQTAGIPDADMTIIYNRNRKIAILFISNKVNK